MVVRNWIWQLKNEEIGWNWQFCGVKVIWPSSIRSSPVNWMNLAWFMLIWKVEIPPKWPLNTTKYRDEPPDLLVHYFQTNSYCLFSPFLRGFWSEMAEYCSGAETTKQMRGFGHEIHGRSVRIELGNIFKLVSWENPPFVKHPSSAIHHRKETISQMTKIARKVLVRSKPSNTAAWWFHVDFRPYLGWSPIISP